MQPKRLVLIAEGQGDVGAAHTMVHRILKEIGPWDCLWLDPHVIRAGGVQNLTGRQAKNWPNKLRVAANRGNLGGALVLLDGDADRVEGSLFCAKNVAAELAARSVEAGGGVHFSVACVFACREFETFLIAGIESLSGRSFADGRPGVKPGVHAPPNLETAPRDAKGWLQEHMEAGYRPTRDQKQLTEMVSLDEMRKYGLRSFRRLENALRELTESIRSNAHIVSPGPKRK